jgi:N-acyl-D-aspartate/D-glutamate deacylase
MSSPGGAPDFKTTGMETYELQEALAIKASLPHTSTLFQSCNALASTHGREPLEALNILAGNTQKNYKEWAGVLNQLAGTKGLEAQAAASHWAGRQ